MASLFHSFPSAAYSLLAATLGVVSSTVFFTMNTTLNYIALPAYFIPRGRDRARPAAPSARSNIDPNSTPNPDPDLDQDHILQQWAYTYSSGHLVGPGSSILSTTAFVCAAWTAPSGTVPSSGQTGVAVSTMYYAAAVSAFVAVPFTVLFILSTNDELYRRADLLEKKANTTTDPSSGSDSELKRKQKGTGSDNAPYGAQGKKRQSPDAKGVEGVDTLTLIRKCHYLSKIRAVTPVPAIGLAVWAIFTISRASSTG